ncbi:MAG: hypothetical protein SX243_04525 [Acidobacteriota bacterium]|nr:hypothetical protein [Acidobacteriota bacterium]
MSLLHSTRSLGAANTLEKRLPLLVLRVRQVLAVGNPSRARSRIKYRLTLRLPRRGMEKESSPRFRNPATMLGRAGITIQEPGKPKLEGAEVLADELGKTSEGFGIGSVLATRRLSAGEQRQDDEGQEERSPGGR